MSSQPTVDPSCKSSNDRLLDALAEMIRQQACGSSPEALTATTLCQLAGISRNALYRYHADVVQALHKLQHQHRSDPNPARNVVLQLREENDALRVQVTKLAALIDHYSASWQ